MKRAGAGCGGHQRSEGALACCDDTEDPGLTSVHTDLTVYPVTTPIRPWGGWGSGSALASGAQAELGPPLQEQGALHAGADAHQGSQIICAAGTSGALQVWDR